MESMNKLSEVLVAQGLTLKLRLHQGDYVALMETNRRRRFVGCADTPDAAVADAIYEFLKA